MGTDWQDSTLAQTLDLALTALGGFPMGTMLYLCLHLLLSSLAAFSLSHLAQLAST